MSPSSADLLRLASPPQNSPGAGDIKMLPPSGQEPIPIPPTAERIQLAPAAIVRGSDLIDGTIGEGSPFQREFGYYAHGVDETTAVLPDGWRERLILITGENTRFVRGWCLEVHDLAIAKYAAGREKDASGMDSGYGRQLQTRRRSMAEFLLPKAMQLATACSMWSLRPISVT